MAENRETLSERERDWGRPDNYLTEYPRKFTEAVADFLRRQLTPRGETQSQ
jgi:hypothetical protein